MTQEHGIHSLRDFLGKWKAHFDRMQESDSLSKSEKEEVLSGLKKLREVFDDAWLWENAGKGFIHPLMSYLVNYAPWSQLWLAEFGGKLNLLRRFAKFEILAERLKDAKEYKGTEAEVEIIAKLIAAGIPQIELFPEVVVKGRPKVPDIKVVLNGQDIYFEVANLGESRDSIRAGETLNEIIFPFNPELIRFCQVHKALSKPHIRELKAKIEKATAKVKETKEHEYVGEPGVLDYLLIHQSKEKECEALVKRFGMKNETTGPPVMRNDIERLELRLRQKVGQLPEGKPGVIIVFGDLFYWDSPELFYEDLVSQVEETIYEEDNVTMGVIINKMRGFEQVNKVVEKPNYILVSKPHNSLQETVLIIKNRYSKFTLNDKILKVFMT